MADVSSLMTPIASTGCCAPGTKTAAGTSDANATGNFLDMMMNALLPMGATIIPIDATTPVASDAPLDQGLLTGMVTADAPPGAIDVIFDDEFPHAPEAAAPLTPFTTLVTDLSKKLDPDTFPVDVPAEVAMVSVKETQLNLQLQAQLAAMTGKPVTAPLEEAPIDPAILNAIVVGGDGADTSTNSDASSLPLTPITDSLPTETEPTADLAARLNAMTVGGGEQNKGDKDAKKTDILSALLQKSVANDQAYQGVLTALTPGYQSPITPGHKPTGPGTISSMPTLLTDPSLDDPILELNLSLIDPDHIAATLAQSAPAIATSVKAVAGATATSTAHAAVQAVAIHLQQLAQNRDTRSLTLQLNPPELGRMQVKMTYGRDKSVKADILIEKSDTFTMMKHDADALRDALSNAGLQADASSLNFALADHGTFADRHADDTAGASNRDGNTIGDEDLIGAIEIKASEEWSVDPKTGIVRYNILV